MTSAAKDAAFGIFGQEPATFKQGDGDRIAERKHHRCRRQRRQAERTGFGAFRHTRGTSAALDSALLALPVIEISGMHFSFAQAMMSVSTEVSPEFDRAINASLMVIIPRLPWLTSPGWR
jgi:hypothetical protein